MTASDGPRLYTLKQAAERLQISRAKLYQLMNSGELRSVHVGTRRLISEDALAEFIAGLNTDRQPDD
jgi:excisionase family DNA binding protein